MVSDIVHCSVVASSVASNFLRNDDHTKYVLVLHTVLTVLYCIKNWKEQLFIECSSSWMHSVQVYIVIVQADFVINSLLLQLIGRKMDEVVEVEVEVGKN